MVTLRFRAKVTTRLFADGTVAYTFVRVPTFTHAHVDMHELRAHPKYAAIANSSLLPNILARIRRDTLGDVLRLDRIPANVSVDTSGFLAEVAVSI